MYFSAYIRDFVCSVPFSRFCSVNYTPVSSQAGYVIYCHLSGKNCTDVSFKLILHGTWLEEWCKTSSPAHVYL